MKNPFVSAVNPPTLKVEPALWFAFQGGKILVVNDGISLQLPLMRDFKELASRFDPARFFGVYNGFNCYVVELPQGFSPSEAMKLVGLRQLFGQIDDDLFTIAGRAIQVLQWDRSNRYCGSCGSAMQDKEGELAKKCTSCGFVCYPRLSPAVIMTVERGNEILLARSSHFPKGMFSPLAGFVEPGETLEEAVMREVREEVDVEIRNIRYFASQPWPFPHSLMIGFTAAYAGRKIRVDNVEIEDAGWFSPGNMPKLPSDISISRALIDDFLQRNS